MKIFPFNLRRMFPFAALNPAATGSYPHPPSENEIEWTPQDGDPAGDEPLVLPEGENPFDEVPS